MNVKFSPGLCTTATSEALWNAAPILIQHDMMQLGKKNGTWNPTTDRKKIAYTLDEMMQFKTYIAITSLQTLAAHV